MLFNSFVLVLFSSFFLFTSKWIEWMRFKYMFKTKSRLECECIVLMNLIAIMRSVWNFIIFQRRWYAPHNKSKQNYLANDKKMYCDRRDEQSKRILYSIMASVDDAQMSYYTEALVTIKHWRMIGRCEESDCRSKRISRLPKWHRDDETLME